MNLPFVTSKEMTEIDREMIDDYGIDLLIMMENAGKAFAQLAKRALGDLVEGKKIAVLAGKGNNGGGGLVAARHLHNWGALIHVILGADAGELKDVPRKQLEILRRMGVGIGQPEDFDFHDFDLLLDALIGYNLRGDPRERIASMIRTALESGRPIISLDVPSGLDSSSGVAYSPCIIANATLTLALPKTGLRSESKRYYGNLYLADISIPRKIYQRFGIDKGLVFRNGFFIPLTI